MRKAMSRKFSCRKVVTSHSFQVRHNHCRRLALFNLD